MPSSVNVKMRAYSFPYWPIFVSAVLEACMIHVCVSASCISSRTATCRRFSHHSVTLGRNAPTVKFEYRGMMVLRYARYSSLLFAARPMEDGRTWCWQSGVRYARILSISQALYASMTAFAVSFWAPRLYALKCALTGPDEDIPRLGEGVGIGETLLQV